MKLLDQFVRDCGTDLGIGQYFYAKDTHQTKEANRKFYELIYSIFPGKESEQTKETELRNQILNAQAELSVAQLQQGAAWGIRLGARLTLELVRTAIIDED